MAMGLSALALNCTLKASDAPSSAQLMADLLLAELAKHDVGGDSIRVVDHTVRPGVRSDEGDGDEWPAIRARVLAADILVVATPIWLGNPSSVCQRVLERMDAFLAEEDDRGRPIAWDRVAIAGVVGNEDGAHNVGARLYQGLNDVGFTIPAGGMAYWVGEAMGAVDFGDLPVVPDGVQAMIGVAAANAAHLARLLREAAFPA